uniref:WAP domain-containing protein n=1 Tax=Strigamia maritima TaxID=126957 RepID=T1JG80_STRMM
MIKFIGLLIIAYLLASPSYPAIVSLSVKVFTRFVIFSSLKHLKTENLIISPSIHHRRYPYRKTLGMESVCTMVEGQLLFSFTNLLKAVLHNLKTVLYNFLIEYLALTQTSRNCSEIYCSTDKDCCTGTCRHGDCVTSVTYCC